MRRKAERKRIKKAKLRAMERGKKGIPDETVRMVAIGLVKKEGKVVDKYSKEASVLMMKLLSASEGKWERTRLRMVVKNALDRMGIVNTKEDPTKRQKIQKLAERLNTREVQLRVARKNKFEDKHAKSIARELRIELGGRSKFLTFVRNLEEISSKPVKIM